MSSSKDNKRKLYVTGYSQRDDESDIKKAFKKYGSIDEISWKGRFCFITFRDSEDAERAARKMNKEDFHGHNLMVEFARIRQENDRVCYNCGKKGHFARDCRNKQKSRSSSSDSARRRKSRKNHHKKDSSSSSRSGSNDKNSKSSQKSADRSRSRQKDKKTEQTADVKQNGGSQSRSNSNSQERKNIKSKK